MGRRSEPRKLVRWDHETDMLCFLAIPRVMAKRNMKFPWGEVAAYIGDHVSGNALLQHMAKETKKREREGRPVPKDRENEIQTPSQYPLMSASGFGGRSNNGSARTGVKKKRKSAVVTSDAEEDDDGDDMDGNFDDTHMDILRPETNQSGGARVKQEVESDEYDGDFEPSSTPIKQHMVRPRATRKRNDTQSGRGAKRRNLANDESDDAAFLPERSSQVSIKKAPEDTPKSHIVSLRFRSRNSMHALNRLVGQVEDQMMDNPDDTEPHDANQQMEFGSGQAPTGNPSHSEYPSFQALNPGASSFVSSFGSNLAGPFNDVDPDLLHISGYSEQAFHPSSNGTENTVGVNYGHGNVSSNYDYQSLATSAFSDLHSNFHGDGGIEGLHFPSRVSQFPSHGVFHSDQFDNGRFNNFGLSVGQEIDSGDSRTQLEYQNYDGEEH